MAVTIYWVGMLLNRKGTLSVIPFDQESEALFGLFALNITLSLKQTSKSGPASILGVKSYSINVGVYWAILTYVKA